MEQTNSCSNCGEGRRHDGVFCGCFHHKVIPILVLLIAIVFILQSLGVVTKEFVALAWPILLGLAAIVKLFVGKCSCYKK